MNSQAMALFSAGAPLAIEKKVPPKAAKEPSGSWAARQSPLVLGASQLFMWPASQAPLETYDDPFFDLPLEFLGGQKARLGWRTAAAKITAVSVHKQDAFANEVINTELDKVIDRGKDIATALADAQRLLARRANR